MDLDYTGAAAGGAILRSWLAGGAEGLIACMADRVDDAFPARCPRLRIVAVTLKGHDNFDAAACARRGVRLTIVPDAIIAPTAELAVGPRPPGDCSARTCCDWHDRERSW